MRRSETWEAIKVLGIWSVLWARVGYQPLQRLAHRHNWHHTKVMGPFEDGSMQHWCQWCGLRYSTPPTDYAKLIHINPPQCAQERAALNAPGKGRK